MTTKTESTHVDKGIRVGTQIAFIPPHADGDITHMDVEFGFVAWMTEKGGACLCRFWRADMPGVLRTTTCSEGVDTAYLVVLAEDNPHYVHRERMIEVVGWMLQQPPLAHVILPGDVPSVALSLVQYLVELAVAGKLLA